MSVGWHDPPEVTERPDKFEDGEVTEDVEADAFGDSGDGDDQSMTTAVDTESDAPMVIASGRGRSDFDANKR